MGQAILQKVPLEVDDEVWRTRKGSMPSRDVEDDGSERRMAEHMLKCVNVRIEQRDGAVETTIHVVVVQRGSP